MGAKRPWVSLIAVADSDAIRRPLHLATKGFCQWVLVHACTPRRVYCKAVIVKLTQNLEMLAGRGVGTTSEHVPFQVGAAVARSTVTGVSVRQMNLDSEPVLHHRATIHQLTAHSLRATAQALTAHHHTWPHCCVFSRAAPTPAGQDM